MEDLLTALLVERYQGTWWLRRARESMEPTADDLAGVRRRKELDAAVDECEQKRKKGCG